MMSRLVSRSSAKSKGFAAEQLSDLYELAPVGYLTLDPQGTILKANRAVARLLGSNSDRIVGVHLSRFLSTDDADLLYLHLVHAIEDDRQAVCDLQLARQDNVPCFVRLESVRTRTVDGSPRCRTIMSDITALSQAQEVAQRSHRLAALGTLAAGIAHEINNPLWMILLQTEVALAAKDKPDRDRIVRQCLTEIKDLVERGGQIVQSVLRFARQDPTEKFTQALGPILLRARDYTRTMAENKQVRMAFEVPEDLPEVAVNSTEMSQVFVNLLANAINASLPGSRVRLSLSWDSEHLKVSVIDEGKGMSPQERKQIFDPFFTTRREAGGTGLGLNVAHRIVEDHNGCVEVLSTF